MFHFPRKSARKSSFSQRQCFSKNAPARDADTAVCCLSSLAFSFLPCFQTEMASNAKLSDDLKKMDLKEGKNWNDLPAEMKMECIKRMDFPTRWALHYTSHTEKELVESTKWNGELLKIYSCDKKFVTCYSSSKFCVKFEHENHAALESLLRIGKFQFLMINCRRPSFQNRSEIFSRTPFYIRDIHMYEATKDGLEMLKNCRGLKTLEIHSNDSDMTIRELLNDYNEIIANTKGVVLRKYGSFKPEELIQLIEKWIADDKEMGSKFEIYGSSSQQVAILEGLKSAFAGRFQVVELDEERLYISFKEDKHIQVGVSHFRLQWSVSGGCRQTSNLISFHLYSSGS